jgi:hypothetical protein
LHPLIDPVHCLPEGLVKHLPQSIGRIVSNLLLPDPFREDRRQLRRDLITVLAECLA